MTLIDQLGALLPIGAAVVGIAWWTGALDTKVQSLDKRLDRAAPQTDVDNLDERVTSVEKSIAEIHQVKEAQAAQGATLDAIAKNVDRLVRIQDDARRERA